MVWSCAIEIQVCIGKERVLKEWLKQEVRKAFLEDSSVSSINIVYVTKHIIS
jgi:hypothetical protein